MRKSLMMGTSVLMAMTGFGAAMAQEGDTIIVTATKREQTLQEVPVAVSVVDSDVIEKAVINDIIDLQSVVPSLRVSQLERSTNSTFIIRGFGNGGNNIGVEPSVAVFVDGVYRSRVNSSLGDLPNLERIEVLRGPQNTLFGKGASAGVISIVTKAPQFSNEGSAELSVGNYGLVQGKGYVTGPISDNIAYSVSGNFQERQGYTDNLAGGSEINSRSRYGVRGQLLFDVSDDARLRLIGDYDNIDENCCLVAFTQVGPATQGLLSLGGQVSPDPFSYETFVNVTPTNTAENWGLSAHYDQSLGNVEFQSITSYRRSESSSNGDVDFTSVPAIASNLNDVSIDSFTQEFRLLSNGDGNLSWLVGAFYMDETIQNRANLLYDEAFDDYASLLSSGLTDGIEQVLNGFGVINGEFFEPGTGVFDSADQDNINYSIFAQGDYEFSDRLTATVGIGYVNDQKEVTQSQINTDLFSSTDFATALNDPNILRALPLDQIVGADFDTLVFVGAYEAVTMMAFDPADFAAIQAAAGMGDPTSIAILNGIAAATPTVETLTATGVSAGIAGNLLPLQFLPGFVALPNGVEENESDDSQVTYTARLAYDVSDRVNVYGTYATGYKPTSWNLNRDSSPFPDDFATLQAAGQIPPARQVGTRFAGPEEVTVWELGLKASFPRGSVNLAVFDQSIEGFQSTIFNGTGFVLSNAGEQSATGFEYDANFQATDNLTLTVAGLFLDPTYDEYTAAPSVDAAGVQSIVDLSGEQPAGIHTVSFSFGALYERQLTSGTDFFARADYQYEDEIQVVDNVPENILSREVNLVNASMGLAWENGLEASVWGRNIFDDEYFQSGFPTTAQAGSFTAYPNQPSTYGVTIRKRF